MKKQSAGILPFRGSNADLEVFLVHPGGPFLGEAVYPATKASQAGPSFVNHNFWNPFGVAMAARPSHSICRYQRSWRHRAHALVALAAIDPAHASRKQV